MQKTENLLTLSIYFLLSTYNKHSCQIHISCKIDVKISSFDINTPTSKTHIRAS